MVLPGVAGPYPQGAGGRRDRGGRTGVAPLLWEDRAGARGTGCGPWASAGSTRSAVQPGAERVVDEGQDSSRAAPGEARRPGASEAARRWPDLAFFGLCVVSFVYYAALTVYPDPNLDYPFMGGDSWDWIANGLSWAGEDVRFSGRPPLLPLLIAGLDRLSALSALPAALLLVFHLTCVGLYVLLRRGYSQTVAWTVAAAVLVNHTMIGLALQPMADLLAAALLFAALVCVAWAGGRPARYVQAGLLGGLSYSAQQLALLLPLPVVGFLWWRRRADWRRPAVWWGWAVFAGFPLLWHAVKRWRFGWWGDGLVVNWSLLSAPQLDAPGYYLGAALSLAGAPLLALAVIGAILVALRRPTGAGGDLALLSLGVVVTVFGFFAFFYGWQDRRFLVYLVLPAAVLVAEALAGFERHARPWLVGVMAAAALIWSAAPLPGGLAEPIAVTAWPLPPVHLRLPLVGSGGAVPPESAVRLEARPVAVAWARSQPARVWRARRGFVPTRGLTAEVRADDGPAVLFHRPGDSHWRDRLSNRTGNALRRRIHFVPSSFVAPCIEGSGGSVPAEIGRLGDLALYRWRPPGLERPRLLAASDAALRLTGGEEREEADAIAAARAAEARAIARFVDGKVARVVVVAREDSGCTAASLLPFLLTDADLYVTDSESGQEPEPLRGALVEEELQVGDLVARRLDLFGVPAAVVLVDPDR